MSKRGADLERDPDTPGEPAADTVGDAEPAREPAPGEPPAAVGAADATGLVGVDAQPLPPATREELELLRAERDELRDQLLRRRADFENYRKRVERDRHQAGLDATAALVKTLIPALDSLEQALGAANADAATLRAGVELIQRGLLSALEAQGVVSLDPAGQRFDPQLHEALSHEPAPGVAPGIVVEVFRKGYFFKDRLLRAALVKVAGGERPAGGDGEDRNGLD